MNTDEKNEHAEELARSLNTCISAVPAIVRVVMTLVPPEHRKVNVVAMLLVTAAKTVLAAHGFDEEKQIEFVHMSAQSIVFHPEIEGVGVVPVGGSGASN